MKHCPPTEDTVEIPHEELPSLVGKMVCVEWDEEQIGYILDRLEGVIAHLLHPNGSSRTVFTRALRRHRPIELDDIIGEEVTTQETTKRKWYQVDLWCRTAEAINGHLVWSEWQRHKVRVCPKEKRVLVFLSSGAVTADCSFVSNERDGTEEYFYDEERMEFWQFAASNKPVKAK